MVTDNKIKMVGKRLYIYSGKHIGCTGHVSRYLKMYREFEVIMNHPRQGVNHGQVILYIKEEEFTSLCVTEDDPMYAFYQL